MRPGDTPGAFPLVFVHGAMDRLTSFGRLRRRLHDVTTVAYDRRGYAGSADVVPPATSFADHVDDLGVVIDDLLASVASEATPAALEVPELGGGSVGRSADGKVFLVGHSYGGNVVLAYAARRPDRVAGVVAFEPPMSWMAFWPSSAGGSTLAVGNELGPEAAAESFMRRIVSDAVWERLPSSTRAARRAEGAALLLDLGGLRTGGWPFDPSAIRCPVICVHGGDSLPHHIRGATEMAATLGPEIATLASIPGSKHGGHLSHPVEVEAIIRELMKG